MEPRTEDAVTTSDSPTAEQEAFDAAAEPSIRLPVLPKKFCGRCFKGYLYRLAGAAGWRRARAHDTPADIAWTVPSAPKGTASPGAAGPEATPTLYFSPRGKDLMLAEMCNCVRRLPENDYPIRHWQELDYAECSRA